VFSALSNCCSSNLKQAIEGWFKKKVTCEIVAQKLVSFIITPDFALHSLQISLFNAVFAVFFMQ